MCSMLRSGKFPSSQKTMKNINNVNCLDVHNLMYVTYFYWIQMGESFSQEEESWTRHQDCRDDYSRRAGSCSLSDPISVVELRRFR
jgi:hypothetical protein